MASSMKDIKLRIHSVESTMQITRAMELVARPPSCAVRRSGWNEAVRISRYSTRRSTI